MEKEKLHRFFAGTTSIQEGMDIRAWMEASEENKRIFYKERKLFDALMVHDDQTTNNCISTKRIPKIIRQWLKIASVIILTLTINYLYQEYKSENEVIAMNTVSVPAGQRTNITLPDGTNVWLNARTTLQYPVTFSQKQRTVFLKGEAYFEVTKNRHKPFTVQSDAIRVRVLGTTFNLKSDKRCRIAEATLIEGEIEVKGNKEEGQIILTPGQRAELNKNNGRLTVKQVDAKLDAVWHDNLIPFQKADIFTITKALERFYDVKIILSPDIQTGKTYSGVLKRKSNIESVLKSLQNSIPIDYKIVGNNIFISPK